MTPRLLSFCGLIVAGTLLCTCSGRPTVSAHQEAAGATGGGKRLPSIVQKSVPTGSTNVDPTKGILYVLEDVGPSGTRGIAASLEAASGYFDASGALISKTRVQVDSRLATGMRGDVFSIGAPTVTVTPVASLAADTWYEFRPGVTTEYLVKTPLAADGTTSVRFFTGSAPSIRFVSRSSLQKGTEEFVYVALSESVALGDLASGIVWSSPSGFLAGCVYREGSCVSPKETLQISAFDFKFEAVSSFQEVARLAIPGTVGGAGRTFAQAASLQGRNTPPGGQLTYGANAASWSPCRGGDAMCWYPR